METEPIAEYDAKIILRGNSCGLPLAKALVDAKVLKKDQEYVVKIFRKLGVYYNPVRSFSFRGTHYINEVFSIVNNSQGCEA